MFCLRFPENDLLRCDLETIVLMQMSGVESAAVKEMSLANYSRHVNVVEAHFAKGNVSRPA